MQKHYTAMFVEQLCSDFSILGLQKPPISTPHTSQLTHVLTLHSSPRLLSCMFWGFFSAYCRQFHRNLYWNRVKPCVLSQANFAQWSLPLGAVGCGEWNPAQTILFPLVCVHRAVTQTCICPESLSGTFWLIVQSLISSFYFPNQHVPALIRGCTKPFSLCGFCNGVSTPRLLYFIESYRISCWKAPIRNIESLLLAGLPKIKSYQ